MIPMNVLIIRFSSFGDIFQALEAASHLNREGAGRVDWLVREDFAELLEGQSDIATVHRFHRKASAMKLIRLAWNLADRYTHVYDAHSNLRSLLVRWTIRLRWFFLRLAHPFDRAKAPPRFMIERSKERLRRFLFFKFRVKSLPAPYRGAESFLRPLRKWIPELQYDFQRKSWKPQPKETEGLSLFKSWRHRASEAPLIALAPSAAWPNKRWPVTAWREFVIEWLETSPEAKFLLLGGPEDRFLDEIEKEFGSDRVFNAVGKVSLLESSILLSQADGVVANDTGLLHVADRLQIPSVVIIGPTAFGYPVAPASRVAEVPNEDHPEPLACKPCSKDGRDPCTNAVHLKCLISISPHHVVRQLREAFKMSHERLGAP